MNFLKRAVQILGILLLLDAAWALKLSLFGHEIIRTTLGDLTIRVERIPYKFSLLTPLYGGCYFSGFVRVRVFAGPVMELSSFSVYGDSFYPDTAVITRDDEHTIHIKMTDGVEVKCNFDGNVISWSK